MGTRNDANRTRSRGAWALGVTLGACSLLLLLVRHLGPRTILDQCLALGSVLPAVLGLTALKYPLRTVGWRLALPPAQRPPWWPSLRATLAGEAIGYVTLAGPVTAEPFRAALLKSYVAISPGITAGAIERFIYAMTGALVVAFAMTIAAGRFGRSGWIPGLVAAVLAIIPVVVVLFHRTQRHRMSGASLLGWRELVKDVWDERPEALIRIGLLCLAQQAVMVGEAHVMLNALGAHASVANVLMFEGVSKAANSIGAIVPGRLGIAEGGSAAMAGALGIGASYGVSLVLMRRVRGLIWSAVGLVIAVPDAWRLSRSSATAATVPPATAAAGAACASGCGAAPPQ